MKIGIDISQIAHQGTGVANYVKHLVEKLVAVDSKNEYILFYSSMRKRFTPAIFNFQKKPANVTYKVYNLPPTILDVLWNKLHIAPIEQFIGDIDVFISSDWVQPPVKKAKSVTVLYDLIIYKYPEETHNQTGFNLKELIISPNIVAAQKRRLHWVKKECDAILCISEATKQDAQELLGIDGKRLKVVYPGI